MPPLPRAIELPCPAWLATKPPKPQTPFSAPLQVPPRRPTQVLRSHTRFSPQNPRHPNIDSRPTTGHQLQIRTTDTQSGIPGSAWLAKGHSNFQGEGCGHGITMSSKEPKNDCLVMKAWSWLLPAASSFHDRANVEMAGRLQGQIGQLRHKASPTYWVASWCSPPSRALARIAPTALR